METAWKEKLLACTQACAEWIDSIETEIPGKGLLAGFHPPVWGTGREKTGRGQPGGSSL